MTITLRKRKLKKGRIKLYLDIYKGYTKSEDGKILSIRDYEKGDIVGDINSHLKSKSLIGDHVQHKPYKEGASMYVSKFICDEKVNYNMIKND